MNFKQLLQNWKRYNVKDGVQFANVSSVRRCVGQRDAVVAERRVCVMCGTGLEQFIIV